MTEIKLANAVGPTWDACIRIIPVAVVESVRGVVFSPSGALIAAHGECCVKVFDSITGVNRATFDGHKSIYLVAFSPDDKFLVFGLCDATINVWDVQTGTLFRTFKWDIWSSARSLAFSSSGTMIASGDADGAVRIWNILSGGCDCVFQGHSGAVTDVCWLARWNQIVSASRRTVRIWDVQKQMCSKIFSQYSDPVVALASSRDLWLVAYKNGTVSIYDSQSCAIIHVITSNVIIPDDITNARFSIDGGKVLVARWNSGDIWDTTTNKLTRVGKMKYNGEQATFSPDGTRVASVYGKFLKIWKTDARYNRHKRSTHVYDTIDDVYISPDGRLIALKFETTADILDATTGQFLFPYLLADFLSIKCSLDFAFVAFLRDNGTVRRWNGHIRRYKTIAVDNDVFDIALSPDGSRLVSLSPSHMKLWDLKCARCLAHLEFDRRLQVQAQVSFVPNATSVSVLTNSGTQSWHISPDHNIDLTRNPIKNGDGTKSWLIARPLTHQWGIPPNNTNLIIDPIKHGEGTKLPMVFVPTTEERSNQDASAPCQSYYCDTDDEWILDQDGRRVLWIPPDERPRKIWRGSQRENKFIVVQTESGKVYFVYFPQS